MIDMEFLERLISAIEGSSLDSIELERGGTRLRLSKTPDQTVTVGAAAAPAPAPAGGPAPAAPAPAATPDASPDAPPTPSSLVDIPSPMVGTFYRSPAPDAPAYVEKGAQVGEGDTLCIIEAMKLMNELEAEVPGTIAEICVENGEPVEYGQVLFRIEPS
ncbi:MAG: acetyl-CoA carboxylase biotin carboxyl carrier protein [Longimicrobiales bacterium]|nr:acetyl-CoA carboxylase biotin carboxyl carrier protein [Longimicrobiales bacterium]